jgi:O-antigen/teichoic acid export membrane protein
VSEHANAPSGEGRKRLGLGRLFEDLAVLSGSQFLSKMFGFLAFAFLARRLTLEEYGALETAVGMAAIGAIALELGTGSAAVRRVAQKADAPSDILGAVIFLRLAIGVVVAPALAIIYAGMTKSDEYNALYYLFAASLFAVPFNHAWFFQSQERMFVAGFGQTLKMGVFLLAVLGLVPQTHGVIPVAFAEMIAVGAMVAWYAYFATNAIGRISPRRSLNGAVAMFRESATLGMSNFANALAQYLPLLIVAALVDDAETAMYGASQRLVISLATFSYIYFFNLYPMIARLLAADPASLDRLMASSGKVVSWAGVATCGALCALAPLVMRLIYGERFEAAGAEFSALVWSGFAMLCLGNAKWLLTAGNRQGAVFAANATTAVVVIALCFALTPSMGGVGAAIAFNAGFLAQWAVAHVLTRGMVVRPRLADNAPAAAASLVIIAALVGFRPDPAVSLAIVAAVVGAGVALDRKLPASLRELASAKSGEAHHQPEHGR